MLGYLVFGLGSLLALSSVFAILCCLIMSSRTDDEYLNHSDEKK